MFLIFVALAHITAVVKNSLTLQLSDKFRNLAKKQADQIFDIFREGIGTDVELVCMRMQQSLSIYIGCQSQKSVHHLDNAYESGKLLAVLRECSSSVVRDSDIESIHWDVGDFNRCVQYFRNLSGKIRWLFVYVVKHKYL